MGKTAALEGATLAHCRDRFRTYYAANPPPAPPDATAREYALAAFDAPGMRRHLACADAAALAQMVSEAVPRHVYYSSAYYAKPQHLIMKEKGWKGADVIFDLDADLLKDAEGRSYADQLDRVKVLFVRLVEDYLLRDFGLGAADLQLVFSGGRGYHAHIRRESFRELSSAERRALVNYVMGEDFVPSRDVFHVASASTPAARGAAPRGAPGPRPAGRARLARTRDRDLPRLPLPDGPGWGARFTRSLFELLDDWSRRPPEEVVAALEELLRSVGLPPLPPKEASRLASQFFTPESVAKIKANLALGNYRDNLPLSFLDAIARRAAVMVEAEADAPVTTDIHRLIRLPGSLHGGTGLRVTPLSRSDLGGFEPLRDAWVPSGGSLAVRLRADVDYPLGGVRRTGTAGAVLDLPEAQGLFLLLRGEAEVIDG